MDLKLRLRVLVAAVVLGAAGCSAEPAAQSPTEPAQTARPSPTASSAIDGTMDQPPHPPNRLLEHFACLRKRWILALWCAMRFSKA